MGTYVTDTGFQKKTLTEIKAEIEADFQGVFGNDIDLSAEGAFGQLIGILSKRDADLWDGMEEIYTSRNPSEATGTSLDNISAETGVVRIDATQTLVEDVQLFGSEGTVVAAGKQIKQTTDPLLYSLLSVVTITKTAARHVQLEPDTPSGGGGEVYTVTIDATPYTYTALAGDTKADVINALVSAITTGAFNGTASNISDTYLKVEYITTDFSITWTTTLTLYLLASGGDFEADEEGPYTAPANTLVEIATPVTNWDSVNNPVAGITGRDVETDDELRIRRAQTFLAGNATDVAIQSALLNEVTGVTSVTVTSNRKTVSNSNKIVFDADFVTGNSIQFVINNIVVTSVPFNTDQETTMQDAITQIEADVPNSTALLDDVDANDRTLVVTVSNITLLESSAIVTGGASQPTAISFFCDQSGRPVHSFEAVVSGGTDADIANEIWVTQPSGIQSYGNVTEVIQDSEGNNQSISFSRPVDVYAHVKVKRDLYAEETYPTNGDQAIKDAIVEWSLTEFIPGKDLIRQRISIPVYSVPGIDSIEISIDLTPNPGDTPSYVLTDLPVTSRQIAVFDQSRITVEVLTP